MRTMKLDGNENSSDESVESPNILSTAMAKYSYEPQNDDELPFTKGDVIKIFKKRSDGWWKGMCRGRTGLVPSNYVDECPPTPSVALKPRFNFSNAPAVHPPNAVTTAVAIYAYEPQKDDELRLTKGDLVDVYEKRSDGWWKGECRGQTGWLPSNYVNEYSSGPPSPSTSSTPITKLPGMMVETSSYERPIGSERLLGKPYYYGKISRREADAQLNDHGEVGDFLLRDSASSVGEFSIAVKAKSRNKHFLIKVDPNGQGFTIGPLTFPTMDALLRHFASNPMDTDESSDELFFLIKPLQRHTLI